MAPWSHLVDSTGHLKFFYHNMKFYMYMGCRLSNFRIYTPVVVKVSVCQERLAHRGETADEDVMMGKGSLRCASVRV